MHDKICPTCATATKDSVVYKIDTVKVQIPGKTGPTVYVNSPCDSSGKLKPFVIEKEKNGIKTKVYSENNNIVVETDTKDTTQDVQVPVKESYHSEDRPYCDKEHRTSFDNFCRWWFYITGGIVVICLAIFFGPIVFRYFVPLKK